MNSSITIALAQISPVWLNKAATINKMLEYIAAAAAKKCDLIAFGEALLPGYPFWVELTQGAKFNATVQKEMYAHYAYQSISISNGDLAPFCQMAKEKKINILLGFMERADDRAGHSLYCSLTNISSAGVIEYVHRKLMPTYEERLVWAIGDGNGLQVRQLNGFTVGALNCWENWMPLVRSTLYAQGENLHIALWPGSVNNTSEITRFIAKESRSYVVSVSSLLQQKEIPSTLPIANEMIANSNEWLADGGSCIAAPNGEWLLAPVPYQEGLFVHTLPHQAILEERQNFDPSGHYSRPDVLQLNVDRQRQKLVHFKDES